MPQTTKEPHLLIRVESLADKAALMQEEPILTQEVGLDLLALSLIDQVFLKIVQRKVICKEISKEDTADQRLLSHKNRAKFTTW